MKKICKSCQSELEDSSLTECINCGSNQFNEEYNVVIEVGSKSINIEKKTIITRKLWKDNFEEYDYVFKEHFLILQDNSKTWFVKGLSVPKEIKSKGTILVFDPFLSPSGEDLTNKVFKITSEEQEFSIAKKIIKIYLG